MRKHTALIRLMDLATDEVENAFIEVSKFGKMRFAFLISRKFGQLAPAIFP
jgi:hypothetical protein